MEQNKKWIVGGLLVVTALVLILIVWKRRSNEGPQVTEAPKPQPSLVAQPQKKKPEANCQTSTEKVVVADGHMRGLLKQGETIDIVKNWYACHPIQAGDVVYYRFSTQFSPVIRVVRGVGGDRFHLIKDKKKKNWNIAINDSVLNYEGKPYFFGVDPPPVLSLYENDFKGILPKDVVILFSNVPPGDRDSSTFGVANINDILGKVILKGLGT